ncbi:hypothetical protein DTO013E5_8712 [Penicillium roqueforti]|nr:hypothetical protein CBS147337_9742 [Penicillium roqueforti]KAI2673742.1 hypothetical protein CBS147355_7501 [Penicillium roqueforti]KAI2684875.1 hypothetical protein LCP963914a_4967 [Penicillium roqueforti]KAI2694922.1 hypothetical protein CBS147372_9513 [Penicillium roqueforti]KAI2715581.1 hypothetical protein CBS147318_6181 [Penicillium roqueforti]
MAYQKAIGLLQQCRRPFPDSSATLSSSPSVPKAPNASTLKGSEPLLGMRDWLLTLGHDSENINRLNVIHVAGTKGKGSTCAYVDCFLREHAKRNGLTRKIGLYTSPSLWPRNRIRIDSNPLPVDLFARRFFEVYRGLSLNSDALPTDTKTPGFLQMLAILAFHTFIEEGVDVVICETHHGGQFDATNFVDRPAITAITKIGMDHVENLGRTLKHIAWHKSGIFKKGVLSLSVSQDQEVESEIERRALEMGSSLQFIRDVKGTLLEFVKDVHIEDLPLEQLENCALAIQIAHRFLYLCDHSLDGQDVLAGIEKCRWPGRFDIIDYSGCTWYLDGAHNETSMAVVAKWYNRVASTSSVRVLIFAHFSPKRTRDWKDILKTLGNSLQMQIQHVIFVEKIEYDDHFATPSGWPEEYAQFWREHWPTKTIYMAHNVRNGIDHAKMIGIGGQILVTGSLYLVEAALGIVKNEPC